MRLQEVTNAFFERKSGAVYKMLVDSPVKVERSRTAYLRDGVYMLTKQQLKQLIDAGVQPDWLS